ncbi:hypothetical protein PO145_10380, partial [Limosilactobacillus mucosae]|nr:hypothetical protein [Limosilactobacillus mucosae]
MNFTNVSDENGAMANVFPNQVFSKKRRLGKKSYFPLNLNEIPDKSGRLTTDFVRYFCVYIFIFIPGLP